MAGISICARWSTSCSSSSPALPERVFGKQELLRSVWGYRSNAATRTVDSHASRLRRKLDVDGSGRWVVNVRGVGYRLI